MLDVLLTTLIDLQGSESLKMSEDVYQMTMTQSHALFQVSLIIQKTYQSNSPRIQSL